jgi:hypothetical protein
LACESTGTGDSAGLRRHWLDGGRQDELPEPHPAEDVAGAFADDYGYHYGYHDGSVWYRGRFSASGAETSVCRNAITCERCTYLVWLNGRYLGSAIGWVQADADSPVNVNPGPGNFPVPANLLKPGKPATLAVLVQKTASRKWCGRGQCQVAGV